MSDNITEFGKRPEIDPEKQAEYDRQIQKARAQLPNMSSRNRMAQAKGHAPVGHVERPDMPDLSVAAATSPRGGFAEELKQGVQPRPAGSPALTEQTARQLADMAEASKSQQPDKVQQALDAKLSPPAEKADTADLLDALNFDDVRNEAERIHNNRKRRDLIEARCEAMSFDDLLWSGEVKQLVPIIPGKFEVTFKSITGDENLFIRKYLAKRQRVSDAHDYELYQTCQLAMGVSAISGATHKVFPEIKDSKGEIDEKTFEARLHLITKMALPILADLSVNFNWFDMRVRKLIVPDDLKNG
jgi:hypothetical protein